MTMTYIWSCRHGQRYVVKFHEGRKIMKLLDTATLKIYTVTPAETKNLKLYDLADSEMAKRLDERAKHYKKIGVGFPEKSVAIAIKKLEVSHELLI